MSNLDLPRSPPFLPSDVRKPGAPLAGFQLDELEKSSPLSGTDTSPRRSLRIAICSENWLPKVDGVTRTLAMLLQHLQREGHEAIILGPESGMERYAGHEVVGTKGIPLLGVYKGLALNFIRPKFIRKLREFKPDVIQFVDPIWLCAQVIPVVQYYMPEVPLLTSYHTNLAMYATLFGFPWLTPVMWNLQRNLHGRCRLTYCPSPSTARMLESQGFENVRLWPRGVDTSLFTPAARDYSLRQSWGAEPSTSSSAPSRRTSLDSEGLPGSPPSYATAQEKSKVVLLYVGRISWEKNLRLLVEAARGLHLPSEDGTRPACQLVFVGDGPSRKELEALCASYELDAVFMGYRKGQELATAFASADIFAFPSWTETFGQVVLESLASGLPVVGLRAEGVCDLVKHEQTGLLLDLDDLLPTTTAEAELKQTSSPIDPPTYTPTATFRPLPENPHALVDVSAPTFPLAVSMYRAMLVDLSTNHSRRRAMGEAAARDAATRSWHGAMEMLVDGYREISLPVPPPAPATPLSLSRTSTIELDIVCDSANADSYAESTAAAVKRGQSGKLLRLGGVFRRTGGRFKEGSMSIKPLRSWLAKGVESSTEVVEGIPGDHMSYAVFTKPRSSPVWATRWLIKLALLSYFFYFLSAWVLKIDAISAVLA